DDAGLGASGDGAERGELERAKTRLADAGEEVARVLADIRGAAALGFEHERLVEVDEGRLRQFRERTPDARLAAAAQADQGHTQRAGHAPSPRACSNAARISAVSGS